jgi:hypothetical protein
MGEALTENSTLLTGALDGRFASLVPPSVTGSAEGKALLSVVPSFWVVILFVFGAALYMALLLGLVMFAAFGRR